MNNNRYNIDPKWIASAQGGNLSAFEKLYALTKDMVYNYIRNMVGNDEDAFDLAQDTYVRAWKSLKHLKEEKAFVPWLMRIARNVSLDSKSAVKTLQLDNTEEDIPDATLIDIQKELEQQADTQAAAKAILKLPEIHRSVVVMHHINEMTVEQTAEALDIPVGTVLSRLARARLALRKMLAPFIENQGEFNGMQQISK